jgi:YspA, cpYpsA-related SLOG family
MLRVLVCGDRNWDNEDRIREVLEAYKEAYPGKMLIVDGAAKGADSLGHKVAKELGLETERFPAAWSQLGRRAGPIRNQEMLDSGLNFVLAFHEDLESSKGTKDMVTRARKRGVPVYHFDQ